MKLVSFSVENYRSITTARKIPVSDYSVLIGANNEGKSNILHALALGMSALENWKEQVRRLPDGRVIRRSQTLLGRARGISYNWEHDYPINKQKSTRERNFTNVVLEFSLTEREVVEFEKEVASRLNGTLPIQLSFKAFGAYDVAVMKQGRGHASLNRKSTKIADFVSRRIRFEYIPAIRTADSASQIVNTLLERELSRLEANPEYRKAVETIENLQIPVLEEIQSAIHQTISNFLPSVKSVRLEPGREARYRALRREVEVLIDDGNETRLSRKGDGIQSLVALALMRHAGEEVSDGASTIFAIEEPEAHLHPRAIHELRNVIREISQKNQTLLASHSPLFVNPTELNSTILVEGRKVRSASHIGEIRDALGVRFSDNLYNAYLVILVEGADDARSVRRLLMDLNDKLKAAFQDGHAIIDHLAGASSLAQKASYYSASACKVHCLLDNDHSAILAVEKALKAKVIEAVDYNLCTVLGLAESELEDHYDVSIYGDDFFKEFGVDPRLKITSQKKSKWSDRMAVRFSLAGKIWNEEQKIKAKTWLSHQVEDTGLTMLKQEISGPIRTFAEACAAKLPTQVS